MWFQLGVLGDTTTLPLIVVSQAGGDRLAGRHISRDEILGSVDTYRVVESYPDDKYLPSYLVLATAAVGGAFHVLFAADVEGNNVRVITAYHPSPEEWEPDFSSRKGNV